MLDFVRGKSGAEDAGASVPNLSAAVVELSQQVQAKEAKLPF